MSMTIIKITNISACTTEGQRIYLINKSSYLSFRWLAIVCRHDCLLSSIQIARPSGQRRLPDKRRRISDYTEIYGYRSSSSSAGLHCLSLSSARDDVLLRTTHEGTINKFR